MKQFKKNPAASEVFIPGVGRLAEGRILMGNEYEKYAPRFLVEVPEAGSTLENSGPSGGPALLTEPLNAPAVPLSEGHPQKLEEDGQPVKRPRGRPRKHPLP
jgi:hypothetical protein